MVKDIVTDQTLLRMKSVPATDCEEDRQVAQDLIDTLDANSSSCAGLAANMIGILKRIIVTETGEGPLLMYNPKITKSAGRFLAREGCLSLKGERPARRYKRITVQWLDEDFEQQEAEFVGFVAEVIQHEIDHCNGVII